MDVERIAGMDFVFISVPHFIGEKNPARIETELIKNSGFPDELDAFWVEIEPDFENHDDPVVAVNVALAEAVVTHGERFPVILAGDCVSCIGAVKGLQGRDIDPAVIWYDAHGDFNTPETSPSGFLGGMPLAAIVGRGNEQLMQGVGLDPLPEDRLLVTDVRDLDPEEGEMLRGSDAQVFDSVDGLMEAVLPDRPLYIHLDVDILDPQYMPGLGYPADSGPDVEQVNRTLHRLATEGEIAGLLVSLFNAEIANDQEKALNNTLSMMRALIQPLQEK